MLLTMFLLGLVYVVFVGVLFAVGASALTLVVVALVLLLLQLFTSDKIAMATMGVKEVSPAEEPELHGIVERLCVQADLPKPRVCVMETSMPNAFAMGRSRKSTTVCATRGILEMLSPAELEGVMAHELTHVINRDVMVMTLASFFASIAAFITQVGFWFGGAFDDNNNGPGFIVVILVSAIVYVVSWLLLQALSRYREFAADRGSAILTGRPSALISALYKIEGTMQRIPQQDLRAASGELAAFYIMPPRAKQTVATLFSTHPPLEARIARLQRLEGQLQGTAR
jgi:heat shock protein HtpX